MFTYLSVPVLVYFRLYDGREIFTERIFAPWELATYQNFNRGRTAENGGVYVFYVV